MKSISCNLHQIKSRLQCAKLKEQQQTQKRSKSYLQRLKPELRLPGDKIKIFDTPFDSRGETTPLLPTREMFREGGRSSVP